MTDSSILPRQATPLHTPRAAAIRYGANHGWHVFTVQHDKNPYPKTHGHLDATDDPAAIAEMFDAHPEANVAIACGASRLICIDVDPRNGGDQTWQALKDKCGRLPRTTWQRTPSGGFHLLYRRPAGVKLKGIAGPGVDLKVNGYAVVAPSQNGRGPYRWIVSPDEQEPAELPAAWIEEFTDQGATSSLPREYVKISVGARQTTLSQYAGRYRRLGHHGEELYDILWAINTHRCEEPLDEREVRKIAESYSRREGGEFEIVDPPPQGTREVAVLRRENAELKREVTQQAETLSVQRARIQAQDAEIAVYRNTHWGPAAQPLVAAARVYTRRVQAGRVEEDGSVYLPYDAVVDELVGKDAAPEVRARTKEVVKRGIAKADQAGKLEKRTESRLVTYDEETGEIYEEPQYTRRTFVRWSGDFITILHGLAETTRPEDAPKRGGSRIHCPKHPTAKVLTFHRCADCGDEIGSAPIEEPAESLIERDSSNLTHQTTGRTDGNRLSGLNMNHREPDTDGASLNHRVVRTVFIEEANELIALAREAEAAGDKTAAEELWMQPGRLL